MKNGFRVIDSDMHIMEPLDLWDKYMDARFRDRGPRPVRVPTRGDLSLLMIDGKEPRQNSPTLAHDVRMISGKRNNTRGDVIEFARKQGFNAKSQIEAMEIEGIDVAVLFPTACLHIMTMPDMDPLLADAICRAYNDWLYDFCQENPKRLYGAALLPPHDVSLAVREARRAREKLGFVTAFLRGQMVTMVDIILGGVLERFSQLKVAFLECNCGWAPSWLQRMDRHWMQLGKNDAPLLTMKPSEYFKRQCVIGCEGDEADIGNVCQLMGDDNLVFSSDYPHSDSDFPKATQEFFHQEMPAGSRRKILWDNCVKFYGIDT